MLLYIFRRVNSYKKKTIKNILYFAIFHVFFFFFYNKHVIALVLKIFLGLASCFSILVQ